jgi:hypothetical protein
MRTFVRVAAGTLGIAALVLLAGSREAEAAPRRITACIDVRVGSLAVRCEERGGGGGGQLVDADVVDDVTGQATVCGNAVGVLGDASATCDGGQSTGPAGGTGSGDGWIAADVIDSATVQGVACGNAVGVGGDADARCDGRQRRGGSGGDTDRGDALIAVDVLRWGLAAQATACGNGVALLGEAEASCRGSQGVEAENGSGQGRDDAAVVGGPVTAQATACGNTVAALGEASASCDGGQRAPARAGGGGQDDAAVVGGPASVQATACGNTVAALGGASASCGTDRAPAGGVGGGGGDVPETPPVTELPQVPTTQVLGAGGAGPGVVEAGGSGFLPQTGRSMAGLVRAAIVLLTLGIGGLMVSEVVAPRRAR